MLELRAQVSTLRCSCRCRTLVQQPNCRLQRSQPPRLAAAVHSSRHWHFCSLSTQQLIAAKPHSLAAGTGRQRSRRNAALPPLAMINVDFASPSLVLGIALIGCGVALLQVRNMQREVSRDADIVVAAMISIVGSTLIFQGWRLDPLLLLCQALTTSVAFWYGLEAFKLRQQVTEIDEDDDLANQPPAPGAYEQPIEPYTSATRSNYLPPRESQIPPWAVQQQQQQQQPDYSRWGLPPADQSMQQYGSYIGQQQRQQVPEGAYAGFEDQYAAPGSSGSLPPLQQQQQYGPPGDYPSSSGSYGSEPYGQPTQQQQYGGYSAPPQGGWYGVPPSSAAPYGQQLPQGLGVPGVVGPLSPDLTAGPEGSMLSAAAVGSVYAAPGAPAGYVGDGTVPLPPAGQQQQRQAADGSRPGQASYERVDDWE